MAFIAVIDLKVRRALESLAMKTSILQSDHLLLGWPTLPVLLLLSVCWPSIAWSAEGGDRDAQPTATQAGPEILKAPAVVSLEAFYHDTTDYKAKFKQVVTTKSPKRRFNRSGVVYFKRPGMMRWDYSVPDQVFYVSNGNALWSYDVEEGIAYKMDVGKSRLFQALGFLTGTASIYETFRVEAGRVQPDGRVRVNLYPKDHNGDFKRVTLFVNPANGAVNETEVEDPLGNLSSISFIEPSVEPLPVSGFDFKVPQGVRVQDLSKEGAL